MKNRLVTSILSIFTFASVTAQSELPAQLWNAADEYTYTYLTASKFKVSSVAYQTNELLAEFDFKKLHLMDLRVNGSKQTAAEALEHREKIAVEDLDLMQIYLLHGGKRYKLVKGCDELFKTQLIEGGRLYQRRYFTELGFEQGAPKVDARLHISMWPDRISFDVDAKASQEIKGEWDIEMQMKKRPNLHYSSTNKVVEDEKSVTISNKRAAKGQHDTFERISCSVSTSDKADNYFAQNTSLVAEEFAPTKSTLTTTYDSLYRAYRVDLNNNIRGNHGMERIKLSLKNTSNSVQRVPIYFQKKKPHYITGLSAVIRDMNQNPTGIPIQVSKNWHLRENNRVEFDGYWFHAFTIVELPANSDVNLELTLIAAMWGRVPAAAHVQLSLAGYSFVGNAGQQWDQSSLGAWGENICYQPDRGMGNSTMTDVRPVLITDPGTTDGKWNWTVNVGGGDFMKVSGADRNQIPMTNIKTSYKRQGPNMTEIIYSGELEGGYADVQITASLPRTDDYIRASYKVKMKVKKDFDFTQLAIFQMGSEGYALSHAQQLAVGNEKGLIEKWDYTPAAEGVQWTEGDKRKFTYAHHTKPLEGDVVWISMYDAFTRHKRPPYKHSANRGLIIKDWKAEISGKSVRPIFAEYSVNARMGGLTSITELSLPQNITKLSKGDLVECDFSMLILPCTNDEDNYYGPNKAFSKALSKYGDSWKLLYREVENLPKVKNIKGGNLISQLPITILADSSQSVELALDKGVGYVPVVIKGVKSYASFDFKPVVGGKLLDLSEQQNYGKDYWQADYNGEDDTWDLVFNVPLDAEPEYISIVKR